MKRVLLTLGSLALVAMLGLTMLGWSPVDAQNSATPATGAAGANQQPKRDAYIAALAEKLGVTTDQLQTAIDQTNQELGMGGMMTGRRDSHRGDHEGRRGSGRSDEHGAMSGIMRGKNAAAAATFLGMTEDELQTEFQSGKTFLEIAAAQGKTTDDVRAFLMQQAAVAIDTYLQNAEAGPAATPAA